MAAVEVLSLGEVEVDLASRRIRKGGGEVSLTALETRLLGYLASRPDLDVPRDELLVEVWGYAATTNSRAVDFTVRRLRKKLGDVGRTHLLTSYGSGYRLALGERPPVAPPPAARPALRVRDGLVDLDRRWFVPDDGDPVALTSQEALLVEVLAQAPGFVAPDRIAQALRSSSTSVPPAVRRLRRKLGDRVVSRRGQGVRLDRPNVLDNLPPAVDPFVDRAEAAQVNRALVDHRCVTLRGPAGVGKSRLALEVARQRLAESAEPVWWVALSSAVGRGSFLHRVARSLSVELTTRDPVVQLGRALAARGPALVVLDNLEQLVDQVPIVAQWLAAAPCARFLLTSRCVLPIDGAQVDVQPLPLASGIRLFQLRAAAICPEAAPPTERVRQVVSRLDGLPLAIELAASRVEQLDRLVANLDRSLDLLSRTGATLSAHTTLRGALDGSWELLDDAERDTLTSLSLFRGAIPRALLPAGPTIGRLRDHSLLIETPSGVTMAETLRQYAGERLAREGGSDRALQRWSDGVLGVTGPARLGFGRAGRHRAALDTLRALRDDLEALATGAPTVADQETAALHLWTLARHDGPEAACLDLLGRLAPETTRSAVHTALGGALMRLGRFDEAGHHRHRALALDPDDLGARRLHASLLRQIGRPDEALTVLHDAARLARDRADAAEEAQCHNNRGVALRDLERWTEAVCAFDAAASLAEAVDDIGLLARIHENRALLGVVMGEWQRASAAAEAAWPLAEALESPTFLAMGAYTRALIAQAVGDAAEAEALLRGSIEALGAMGCRDLACELLAERARLAAERGRPDDAERWFAEAMVAFETRDDRVATRTRLYHAVAMLLAGDAPRAVAALHRLTPAFVRVTGGGRCAYLVFLAVALAATGASAPAAACLAEARSIRTPSTAVRTLTTLAEAVILGDPGRLAAVVADTPRGDRDVDLLLRFARASLAPQGR